MKVELMPGIKSLSGTLKAQNGTRLVFMTRKAPTTSQTKTRLYIRHEDNYRRSSPLSDAEIKARQRFTTFALAVKNMPEERKQQFAKEWQKAKYKFNGKKYNTLRGYIIARLYAETTND